MAALGTFNGISHGRLIAALRSPALVSAAAFAAGGVGFAVGNVALARVLPSRDYGSLALILSLTQVGTTLGALGMPTTINRHKLRVTTPLILRAASTSSLLGLAMALVSLVFYDIPGALACALGLNIALASFNRVGGAFLQSRHRFGAALWLSQIHNWILLAGVPLVLLIGQPSVLAVALLTAAGYLLTSIFGWRSGFAYGQDEIVSVSGRTLWREGLASVGMQLAVTVLFQLDRLLIPMTLSIRDLATYSVLMAIAGSPFRMLQTATGFTLLPRLRQSASKSDVINLIRREAALMLTVSFAAALVVLALTSWIMTRFLSQHYAIPRNLILATIVIGFSRIWSSFASSAVMALGSTQALAQLNLASWFAVLLGATCAVWASRFGLIGVVSGVGAGWTMLSLIATVIAKRAYRVWPSIVEKTTATAEVTAVP